ncbi:hypothetical protein [uncultured Litoreibacter sp.]|uniref:hypothetical protein n=1 Tax=uncultured Litoreibacter sp. TaxID=1392394 RepID=UPI0026376563|nr:hypothetical protein [uncultured Litoreibacter sp.]
MSSLIDLAAKKNDPKTPLDFYREHVVNVFVWPDAWRNAAASEALNWVKVEFGADTIEDVPEQRGVYAFCICVKNSIMPPHGVLVYFGETSRTLRQRYREYVRDSERGAKRPRFENLFRLWPDDLDFFFAPIGDEDCDLRTIEQTLNDAVIPHCVIKDFSAEIRRIVPVLRG